MEEVEKETRKYPSLPSNYVTLAQLQERWLKEQERIQKEEEQKEEEERQRKLQLQKLEEEEQQQKRKLERLKGGRGIDYKPIHWNWKAKEKIEPREEEQLEVTHHTAQATRVVGVKESAPTRRKGGSKGAKGVIRRIENADRAAEIERRLGDFSTNGDKGNAHLIIISKSKGTTNEFRPRRENADRTAVNEREVGDFSTNDVKDNPPARRSGDSKGARSRLLWTRENAHRTAENEREAGNFFLTNGVNSETTMLEAGDSLTVIVKRDNNASGSRNGESKGDWSRSRRTRENADPTAENEREAGDLSTNGEKGECTTEFRPMAENADRTCVIEEKQGDSSKNGEKEGCSSEFRPYRENADPTAEIERDLGHFSMNGKNEKGNVRATRTNTGKYHGNRKYKGYSVARQRGNGEYRAHGKVGGQREELKASGAGMVWVRKGELSDGPSPGNWNG
ncbi:myb-like protein X isoform X2 [Juglans microcarpa x Juglans regia]|uniref:myb-like protein X isoform X2 n=1 Tax=Juglans microcarpa x Juglans regia TaxID=2249226 RepID=UPI001B7E1D3B|nr:myb-like protein X isoform X2 [Juglans microcarpa x Juglans regia]